MCVEIVRDGGTGWNLLIAVNVDNQPRAWLRWQCDRVDSEPIPSRDQWRARPDGAPSPFTAERGQYVPCVNWADALDACEALWVRARDRHEGAPFPAAVQVNLAPDQIDGAPPFPTGPMTPADLARVGTALWGSTWHQPLAEARGVSRTTVARWASGMRGIPADLPEWLRDVAAPQRVKEIEEAVR